MFVLNSTCKYNRSHITSWSCPDVIPLLPSDCRHFIITALDCFYMQIESLNNASILLGYDTSSRWTEAIEISSRG